MENLNQSLDASKEIFEKKKKSFHWVVTKTKSILWKDNDKLHERLNISKRLNMSKTDLLVIIWEVTHKIRLKMKPAANRRYFVEDIEQESAIRKHLHGKSAQSRR